MSIEKQIAELKTEMANSNKYFEKCIAELEKQLTKKGPVVPWVGANCLRNGNERYGHFVWSKDCDSPETVSIMDSPLHPQFMPNDGVNPWPDDMEVQTIYDNGKVFTAKSNSLEWSIDSYILERLRIIGSRPACGWAEYLKER